MHISWKWLSEYVDLGLVAGPEALADLLTSRGLEVEDVQNLSKGFEKVVTAQILEKNRHPQADRLSLCKVSTGQGDALEIVCGATNMKAGDKVALAMIGADLPGGLKIAQSKIRGIVSNGMLCSEVELGIATSSEGILILPPETELGRPLAEVLGRDDAILVLKPTANRGDCLSHIGIAREVAAATNQNVRLPESIKITQGNCPISIHLHAGESSPQFFGVYIEGVKVGPSPEWLVKRLTAVGSRSINNVVDASNYVMLELGHPMHAYDANFIKGGKIGVRFAKEGENLPLLDGQTVTLAGSELVIEDSERAIGLAGVMGGGNSEVQTGSSAIFLECAEFAPGSVRRAATKHVRRTDAAQRFERGIDPMGLEFSISRLAYLVIQLAGGAIRGATFAALPSRDLTKENVRRALRHHVQVPPGFLEKFLGMPVTPAQANRTLSGLGCEVSGSGNGLLVVAPSHRRDLCLKEDLAEEVARSIGYDKIPSTVPPLTTVPSRDFDSQRVMIDWAKDAMVQAGMMEAINFAFTSSVWLKEFGFNSAARVKNPLSEEHEVLVPSLLPGLIRNSLDNWRHNFGSEPVPIRLFELRPTFKAVGEVKAFGEMETGVDEAWKLAFVLTGPRFASGLRAEVGEVDFFDLKGVLEILFETLGTKGVRFQPISADSDNPVSTLVTPGKGAQIVLGNGVIGYAGLLHPAKAKALKCRSNLWICELDWNMLLKYSRGPSEPRLFKQWPGFPPMERDFALVVKEDVTAERITQIALKAGKPIAKVARVFDVYRGENISEGMSSVAVRVIFWDETRSLQESETEAVSGKILEGWRKELGAELRG